MELLMSITQDEQKMLIRNFWALLPQLPGYRKEIKEQMKNQIVLTHSSGNTTSLSKFAAMDHSAFADMLIEMHEMIKADEKETGHVTIEAWRKRVLAAVCEHLDLIGQTFKSDTDKLDFAAKIACRAAMSQAFDRISTTKLQAVYNAFLIKNKILKNNPK